MPPKRPATRKKATSARKAATSKKKTPARTTAGKKPAAKSGDGSEKIFYKIGEVCKMTDTEPYVLRYWESEFPNLAPSKNRSGQRIYAKVDVDMVLRVKELLYDEGYTIAGARRKLEDESKAGGDASAKSAKSSGTKDKQLESKIRKIRSNLKEVLDLLS